MKSQGTDQMMNCTSVGAACLIWVSLICLYYMKVLMTEQHVDLELIRQPYHLDFPDLFDSEMKLSFHEPTHVCAQASYGILLCILQVGYFPFLYPDHSLCYFVETTY
jgi:hypothetical protein